MGIYGHDTDKRTKVWSNCYDVALLQRITHKPNKQKGRKRLVKEYIDKRGQRRVTGNSELKLSQRTECNNGGEVCVVL